MNQKELNMKQKLWLELLKDYDCTIDYYLGKENLVTNALSMKTISLFANILNILFYLVVSYECEIKFAKKWNIDCYIAS